MRASTSSTPPASSPLKGSSSSTRAALLEQLHGILSIVSDTGSLTITLATAKPAAVNQALVSAGIPVDELVHVRASVESLFRELTNASTDKSDSRAMAS